MAKSDIITNDQILRQMCIENAVDIRESQVDMDTPIFVEEVIEDADKLFEYIKKGTKPEQIKIPSVNHKEK